MDNALLGLRYPLEAFWRVGGERSPGCGSPTAQPLDTSDRARCRKRPTGYPATGRKRKPSTETPARQQGRAGVLVVQAGTPPAVRAT